MSFYEGPSKLGVARGRGPLSNASQKRASAANSPARPPTGKVLRHEATMFVSKTIICSWMSSLVLGTVWMSRSSVIHVRILSGGFQGTGRELSIGNSKAQSWFSQNSEYSE